MITPGGRLVASHALSATAMSVPWPALLAATWASTHSATWVAAVAAARVAPYVMLSWYAGSLGDRLPRDRLVRVSAGLRALLLGAAALALTGGQLGLAIGLATATVALGTPAYPTLAAAVPDVDPGRRDLLTRLLVTAEVAAFAVGPALGGLVLATAGAEASLGVAAVIAVGGALFLSGTRLPAVAGAAGASGYGATAGDVVRTPRIVGCIVTVSVVNAVLGALTVCLIALFASTWSGGQRGFGLTTAAVGLGALLAPPCCSALGLRPGVQAPALVALAVGLTQVVTTPTWQWALVPLVIVGLAATQVECAVTSVIQRQLPLGSRATALGITDTAMVSANLVGAVIAPFLISSWGVSAFLAALAGLSLATLPVTATRHRSADVPTIAAPDREHGGPADVSVPAVQVVREGTGAGCPR